MTNEEAREVLQEQIDKYGQEYDAEGIEALEMAIKALEQEPILDKIKAEIIELRSKQNVGVLECLDIIDKYITELNPSYNSIKTELKSSEDCISREKAIEGLGEQPYNWTDSEGEIQECHDWLETKQMLESLPSVTPKRPHGEWIHFTDDFKDYAACSCCGYGEEGEVLLEDKTPFCPVCGADMREGEE